MVEDFPRTFSFIHGRHPSGCLPLFLLHEIGPPVIDDPEWGSICMSKLMLLDK